MLMKWQSQYLSFAQLAIPYRTFRLGSPSYRQSEQSLVALCAPQDAHARLLFFAVAGDALEVALQLALCGSEESHQCCS